MTKMKKDDTDTLDPPEHEEEEEKQNPTGDLEIKTPLEEGGSTSDISSTSNLKPITSWHSNSVTESPPTQTMARSEDASECSNFSSDSFFSIQILNKSLTNSALEFSKCEESYKSAKSCDARISNQLSPIKVGRKEYDMTAISRARKLDDKITKSIEVARNDSKLSSSEVPESSNIVQETTTTATDDNNPSSTTPLKKKKRWSERCCCSLGSKTRWLCCFKLPKCCQCKPLWNQDSCNWPLKWCHCNIKPKIKCCHWPNCSSCSSFCIWSNCSCSCLKSFSSSPCSKCPKGLSCSCFKSWSCCKGSTICSSLHCSNCKWPSCSSCFGSCSNFKCPNCSCFSSCSNFKCPNCSFFGSCIPSCGSCSWPSWCSCKWPGCPCFSRLRNRKEDEDGAVQDSSHLDQDKKQISSSKGWFSCLSCK